MSDVGARLSIELTRIVQCPYPASLSGLADLLAHAHVSIIRRCIQDQAPCAVTKLVTIVCDALPLWPYTLHVLHYLCHAPEFSHQLLLSKPDLLNALLTKAHSSRQSLTDYGGVCILILSRPLPDSVLLPAAAQDFFLHVFRNAVQNPNIDTLKPVYRMLDGACRHLLGLLPHDIQQEFDRELCRMLSSNSAGKDSMLLLWCFGIVLLTERPDEVNQVQVRARNTMQPPSAANSKDQWRTSSGQKLFVSSKGIHKTITLTCMSVVWAMKGVGISDDEAEEGLRIASRVLHFVDKDSRRNWSASGPLAQNTMSKLLSKIDHSSAPKQVLFEALRFYALVTGHEGLQATIVTTFEECLMEWSLQADPEHLRETLSVSLPVFGPRLSETTFRTLLAHVLEACTSMAESYRMKNLTILVEEIATLVSKSSDCHVGISRVLSSSFLADRLWSVIKSRSFMAGTSCCTYRAFQQQTLVASTIASLLTMAFVSQANKSTLSPEVTIALVNLQRDASLPANQCSHAPTANDRPPISLFQESCTPYTGQHLHDWRISLRTQLEGQNQYQRDAIVRGVAQICEDLETRCNSIEEPLRQEQERSASLSKEIVELKEELNFLRSRLTDDELHLQGLEDEKESMEREKRELVEEKEHLLASMQEVKRAAMEGQKQSLKTLHEVREEHHSREMEHRSIILRHEDALRVCSAECEEVKDDLAQLRDMYTHIHQAHDSLEETHHKLDAQLQEANNSIRDHQNQASEQDKEIARLEAKGMNLVKQLRGTEAELEATSSKLDALQITHHESIRTSEEILKRLEAQFALEAADAASRAKIQQNELETQLQDAQRDAHESRNTIEIVQCDLERLRSTVPPLEHRIQELTELWSEQEEELEELRTLRRNVLASMGLATQHPLTIRTAARSQNGIDVPPTLQRAREHRRRKSTARTQEVAPATTAGASGFTNTAMESVANASFASSDSQSSQNGPTPKRPKPRPSFVVPTMHTPYTQKPILTAKLASKKLSPSKRSVLRQMSPNRRHTTVGFARTEHERDICVEKDAPLSQRRISLQDREQADLDMDDDFLAGTPLSPGSFTSGTGRASENDDDTTTEF
ncbi:hypothetical protein ACN47E_000189 [Coniothyrium glycines]